MGHLLTTIDKRFTRSKGFLPGYFTALIHRLSKYPEASTAAFFDADISRFSDLFALAPLPLHVLAHI